MNSEMMILHTEKLINPRENQAIYRNRLEIVASILKKVGNGCKKTHIMYGANLSTTQLRRYLNYLTEMGLLIFDEDLKVFFMSEKGAQLLSILSEVFYAKDELRRSQLKLDRVLKENTRNLDENRIGKHIEKAIAR